MAVMDGGNARVIGNAEGSNDAFHVAFADDGEGWLVNPPNDKL